MPHSWGVAHWPPHVYPGNPAAGRYLVRAHRDELGAYGALTRIGRDLVVLGEGFARFLAAKQDRVSGYQIAANRRAKDAS
jgi:hypothetical protein